jgi:hypothetical protein
MSNNFDDLAKTALNEASFRKQNLSLGELENKLKELNETISKYPAPISKCDAQFNSLLEQRDNTMKEITKLIQTQKEYGGPEGPEPTRYGDWEKKGIVSDF